LEKWRGKIDELPPDGPAEVQNIYSENAVVGGVVAVPFVAGSVGHTTRTITVTTEQNVLGQARVDFRAFD
jgi:hypothetical protein